LSRPQEVCCYFGEIKFLCSKSCIIHNDEFKRYETHLAAVQPANTNVKGSSGFTVCIKS
jgi:hypothetical protein